MLSRNTTQSSDISHSTAFKLTLLCVVAGSSALASGFANKFIASRGNSVDDWGDVCMQSGQVFYGAAFVLTGTLAIGQLVDGCRHAGEKTKSYVGSFFNKPLHEANHGTDYTEMQRHDIENPFAEHTARLN